jgi:subtilase family serine protease
MKKANSGHTPKPNWPVSKAAGPLEGLANWVSACVPNWQLGLACLLLWLVAGPVAAQNRPPVARAGPDLVAASSALVQLNARASGDPDGSVLTYAWAQSSGPAMVPLNNPNTSVASFTPILTGTYQFTLTARDPSAATSTDMAEVIVMDTVSGPDLVVRGVAFTPAQTATQHVFQGLAVLENTGNQATSTPFTVNFYLSRDADLSPANAFLVGAGPPVPAVAAGATVTVVQPALLVNSSVAPGSYFLGARIDLANEVPELSELNNAGASALQMSIVTNAQPVASAVVVGTPPFIATDRKFITLELDGRASSDANGDALTYFWRQTGGPSVFLTAPTSAVTEFSCNLGGNYVFTLTVNDGHQGQHTTSLAVLVQGNSSPVISAPAYLTVTSTDGAAVTVNLDATGTLDPDGDPITYRWRQTNVPPVTLLNANTPVATFTTSRTTSFSFTLETTDGRGGHAASNTVVQIVLNFSPTASAGPSRVLTVTDGRAVTVTLDGRGSSDPDATPLEYTWAQVLGPVVILLNPHGTQPSFTTAVAGSYRFRLQVNDGRGGVDTDEVTITLLANGSPTARTGPAQSVAAILARTVVVALDGTGSTDPDSDPLTYAWTQSSGPAVQLFAPLTPQASFSAGVHGTYRFVLTVSDSRGGVSTAEATATVSFPDLRPVSITVPATADAGASMTGTLTVNNPSAVRLAAPFDAGIFLSVDDHLDAGDARVATVSFSGLEAGQTLSSGFTAPLTLSFPPGVYQALVQVDPEVRLIQSNRANDVAASASSVRVLGPPDVVVNAILAGAAAKVGKLLTLSGTVLNQGQQSTQTAFLGRAYLLRNQIFGPSDVLLGELAFPALASAGSSSFSTSFRVPHGTAPGAWFVGLRLDPGRQVARELDRSNNDGVTPSSTAIVGLPDLLSGGLSAPAQATPGAALPVTLLLENAGGAAAAGNFTYWYYLSSNPVATATGTFLGAVMQQDAIPAGSTATRVDSRVVPRATPPGTYYLHVSLDPLDAIEEEDDSNNLGASAATVTVQSLPELVLTTVAMPAELSVRDPSQIPVTVVNQGNALSSSFQVQAYRSADRVLDLSDVSLGSVTGAGLAAGASATLPLTVTLSVSAPTGAAFLLVVLVSPQAVSQSEEGPPGNLRAAAVQLVDPGQGPRVALTYSRAAPVPAGPLTITATFDEPVTGTPVIAIDQPGALDLAATPMQGSGSTFKYTYTVGADNGSFYRDGEAVVTVSGASDRDGNPNLPATANRFRIDSLPPVLSGVLPQDGSVSAASGTLSGRVQDASTLASLGLSINAGPSVSLSRTSTGLFSGPFSLAGDASDLVVAAVDAAGNRGSLRVRLYLDSDGDGMSNVYERAHGLNPVSASDRDSDPDHDGLGNFDEFLRGTDPQNADTDGDGVSDGLEVARGTDPLVRQHQPPVADAGVDRSQAPGLVVLDGTQSNSPGGGALTYSWVQFEGPAVTLSGASLPNPRFPARAAGLYGFRLTVTDPESFTSLDDVRVQVANEPPSPHAGLAQVAALGRQVLLDGSRSTDANGDPLTYRWTESSSNPQLGLLLSPTSARPSFLPPRPGTYQFLLQVNDSVQDAAAPARVNVAVMDVGSGLVAPNADAGPDQAVTAGTLVTLDGRESADADRPGATLFYRWRVLRTPAAATGLTLTAPTSATPTFQPAVAGAYGFELVVADTGDDNLDSQPDETEVIVNSATNHVPRADAGVDFTGRLGDLLMLDGRGSADTDGDSLSYSWSQLAGPALALPVATGAVVALSPVVSGEYTFGLAVSDGQAASPVDTVRLRVSPDGQNRPPVALPWAAGQNPAAGELRVRIPDTGTLTVSLDGLHSSDPDGDVLSHRWRQTAGPVVDLVNAYQAAASFSPRLSRVYSFALEVSDGLFRDEKTVDVVVDSSSNSVPTARVKNASSTPFRSTPGSMVTLDGSPSSDAESASLFFSWVQLTGPFIDLVGQGTSTLTVTPRLAGTYSFRLFVDDGADRSAGKDVTLVVASGSGSGTTPTPASSSSDSGGSMSCTARPRTRNAPVPAADLLVLAAPLLMLTLLRSVRTFAFVRAPRGGSRNG